MGNVAFTAEVDSETLSQANRVLAKHGISLSDALRQMMNYIATEGRMPHLQCIEPNQETLAAIEDAERGDLITVGSIAELMVDLNEDD